MVNRLGFEEHAHSISTPCPFHPFYREEIILHTLNRLAHAFTHAMISGIIVGDDSARRGEGHNFMMRYLDETCINLVSINILSIWDRYFPSFAESICRKHFARWKQEDDGDGHLFQNAEIMHEKEGSCNTRRLMDVEGHKIIRWESGPDG